MERKYWATRKNKTVGPLTSEDEAVAEFSKAYPYKGPAYAKQSPKNQIMTGWGNFGPSFDIRWVNQI